MATASATPSKKVLVYGRDKPVEVGGLAADYMEAARESRNARKRAELRAHKLWERATDRKLPKQVLWRDEDDRLWILEASVTMRLVPKGDGDGE